MLVPFKDDNPKITENTGFQAGSDSTPMANHKYVTIKCKENQYFLINIRYIVLLLVKMTTFGVFFIHICHLKLFHFDYKIKVCYFFIKKERENGKII